ncbi:MAG: hypothetical protein ACLFPH_05220, partial [Bacteroidales bacterium]
GHVVIMMPERFYVEQEDDKLKVELNSFVNGSDLMDRPISLECGAGTKRIRPSYYDSDNVSLSDFQWYKYKP